MIGNKFYTWFKNYYQWVGGAFNETLLLPLIRATSGLRAGAIRYDEDNDVVEVYDGTNWNQVQGDTSNLVPYTGANQEVQLGEQGISAGYVQLDTTPTNTPTDQGTIYWDDAKLTAALIMNGTTQHIGEDIFYHVKNSTGSPIPKGTAVRFAGTDGNSGHILIAPFLADGSSPSSYFMGVTSEAIDNGDFGKVMHFGELSGINTSAYNAGDLLYASTSVAGGFQTAVPTAPNNVILVAAVISDANNGKILVRPTLGSNINNDEGVLISNPTTGQVLQYNGTSGLWQNATLPTGITGSGTANRLTKWTGTSALGTSLLQDDGSVVKTVYGGNDKGVILNLANDIYFLGSNDNYIELLPNSVTLATGAAIGNGTFLFVDDDSSTIKTNYIGVDTGLKLDFANNQYFFGSPSTGQMAIVSGNFGFGTTTPAASALVDITSTTKGVLMPRMTSTQRGAITSPATALQVYQTDATEGQYIRLSSGWQRFLTTGDTIANIYNSDGTLTSARTINSGGFDLIFTGTDTASAGTARFIQMTPTLVASANSDTLVGLDVQPTFTNGAFTGVANIGIRTVESVGILRGSDSVFVGFNTDSGGTGNNPGIWFNKSANNRTTSNYTMLVDGNNLRFRSEATGRTEFNNAGGSIMTMFSTGNVVVQTGGAPVFDSGFKFDVNGTGRFQGTTTITPAANTSALSISGYSLTGSDGTPAVDISGTWNTTGTPTLIRANVTNTASNANSLLMDLQVGGVSQFRVLTNRVQSNIGYAIGSSLVNIGGLYQATSSENEILLRSNTSTTTTNVTDISLSNGQGNPTITSGTRNLVGITRGFAPTSGNGNYNLFNIAPTINQTGGANGITRGVLIAPTLTAAADWRAIETTNGRWILTDTYSAGSGSLANPSLDIATTWNTTGTPTLIRANVTNTASNAASLLIDLQVGGVSQFSISRSGNATFANNVNSSGNGTFSGLVTAGSIGTGTSIANIPSTPSADVTALSNTRSITPTAGIINFIGYTGVFQPNTATNSQFRGFNLAPTINQTGGANGITRGLHVNPTLTSAADWRSIEWSNNTGWGLYGAGTAANYIAGNLLLNTLTNAGFRLDVNGTARITPPADSTALTISGYSLTGSSAAAAIDITGTWNTSGAPTLIRANVTDTASNANSFLIDLQTNAVSRFRVRKDGVIGVAGTSNYVGGFVSLTGNSNATGTNSSISTTFVFTGTSGDARSINTTSNFIPSSGTMIFASIFVGSTINQTGGANGITRGLFINPTLTSAFDWRSIEWSNNTGRGLWGVGTADNAMAGALNVGSATNANASAMLEVTSTTRGFLLPRMTGAQAEAIATPADGLLVYVNNGNGTTITSTGFWGRAAGAWVKLN